MTEASNVTTSMVYSHVHCKCWDVAQLPWYGRKKGWHFSRCWRKTGSHISGSILSLATALSAVYLHALCGCFWVHTCTNGCSTGQQCCAAPEVISMPRYCAVQFNRGETEGGVFFQSPSWFGTNGKRGLNLRVIAGIQSGWRKGQCDLFASWWLAAVRTQCTWLSLNCRVRMHALSPASSRHTFCLVTWTREQHASAHA